MEFNKLNNVYYLNSKELCGKTRTKAEIRKILSEYVHDIVQELRETNRLLSKPFVLRLLDNIVFKQQIELATKKTMLEKHLIDICELAETIKNMQCGKNEMCNTFERCVLDIEAELELLTTKS